MSENNINKIVFTLLIFISINGILYAEPTSSNNIESSKYQLTDSQPTISPLNIINHWQKSDIIIKTTFFILLIMSVISWYLGIIKYFSQTTIFHSKYFINPNQTPTDGKTSSWFQSIIDSAVYSKDDTEKIPINEFPNWIANAINNELEKIGNKLNSGMSILATIGATAPFIGLFGTVWGILNALTTIGISGQATLDMIATPVGEALFMTALGLAVAVPAIIFYNILLRRNRIVIEQLRQFGHNIHRKTLLEIYQSQ